MDKKYFIKGTSIQVDKGSDLKVTFEKITEKELELLVEAGVLNIVEESILEKAIKKLADKAGITLDVMEDFIYTLGCMNEWVATKLLLKQVAIEMDRKYEGHISKCPRVYFISSHTLSALQIDPAYYNSDRVSLFRSKEEAEEALKCVREYLGFLLNEQED